MGIFGVRSNMAKLAKDELARKHVTFGWEVQEDLSRCMRMEATARPDMVGTFN